MRAFDLEPVGQMARFLGIDVGAEAIKITELVRTRTALQIARQRIVEHRKNPDAALGASLREFDWDSVAGAAVCGRLGRRVSLLHVPLPRAQTRAWQFRGDGRPVTLVSIGSQGFSVLELRGDGREVFRENSRCSQGTGNFLRQLVERFSLSIEEAAAQATATVIPAAMSGRCPVILKSDMTHLANKGEDRVRIVAGLFDAVAENVHALIRPKVCPPRVVLLGGVVRAARIKAAFERFLDQHEMSLLTLPAAEDALFFESLGCALVAMDRSTGGDRESLPALGRIVPPEPASKLEIVPALANSLHRVRRMPPIPPMRMLPGNACAVVLGFDVGSTGAKAVAIDAQTRVSCWESYRPTRGDPVDAARELVREFLASPAARCSVFACGATGSGREIVGSLLATCYGKGSIFILNEIAAHAAGALSYDPRVDTIFEIGGQDAKYIRLAGGRVIDCAMNEACSAGTGSFIEEQGRRFAGIRDVDHFSAEALAARECVSLGQHCSVFMSEVIAEAVAAGIEQRTIVAGLYDSVIQNYLNRVKGNRSVGEVIFCQGMPFASDALAAAVARQTGAEVVIPPSPGTVGALGIALLALQQAGPVVGPALDMGRFLATQVEAKDSFLCRATRGCGVGNRCRIERLRARVGEEQRLFTWGGGCELHEQGLRRRKLPDLTPDPFRERDARWRQIPAVQAEARGYPRVAISTGFMLTGLFPFVATFLYELGLDLTVVEGGDHATLKRGIQESNVPFCAPMQMFHGLVDRMARRPADYVFLPLVRSLPRVDGEPRAVTCPIMQASPDVVRWNLDPADRSRVLAPVIEFGPGSLSSAETLRFCRELADRLALDGWMKAHGRAMAVQQEVDHDCLAIGRRAIGFCAAHGIVPVVVLGRPYTVHDPVLNSNVPGLLRAQGAIAIPLDCYPVDADVPRFHDMYWSHGQRILRAAHQIRRSAGIYSVYCSNYSCGPDSFNLHFFAHIMAGKPFAVIETDGHAGDAGTQTRLEAFLHCVEEDRRAARSVAILNDFGRLQARDFEFRRALSAPRTGPETILLPYIGPASEAVAAVFRGFGFDAESLPMPDTESLRLGRRHTSGKECQPMPLTLGSLLQRLQRAGPGDRFVYFMPGAQGPCRFGVYNLLNQIVVARLGWGSCLRIWSPCSPGYFDGFPAGMEVLLFAGVIACDLLFQAQLDVRPVERVPGGAERVYRDSYRRLLQRLGQSARDGISLGSALWQVASGKLFGVPELLARAGAEFAALRGEKTMPLVALMGEIYVRSVAFSNDFLIEKLEDRGMRVQLAPKFEWLDYCGHLRRRQNRGRRLAAGFNDGIRARIESLAVASLGRQLGWPSPPAIADVLDAARPYISDAIEGEAVLTVGGALLQWHRRQIDAVVNVGPLECMPARVCEAQLQHVAEREGLLSLTLTFNGEPLGPTILDDFAYAVHARFGRRCRAAGSSIESQHYDGNPVLSS